MLILCFYYEYVKSEYIMRIIYLLSEILRSDSIISNISFLFGNNMPMSLFAFC